MNGIITEGYLFATETAPKYVCAWSGRIWSQISDGENRFYQIFQQHIVEVSVSAILYKVYKKPFFASVIVITSTAWGTRVALFLVKKYNSNLIKTSKLIKINDIHGQWVAQLALLALSLYLWESYMRVAVIAAIATGVLHCVSLVAKDMKARIQ